MYHHRLNGHLLNVRLSEMQSRWATLSRQLQQLDQRFREARGQGQADNENMEVLNDTASSSRLRQDDYFGSASKGQGHATSNGRLNPDAALAVDPGPGLSRVRSRSPAPDNSKTIRRQSSIVSFGVAVD